ncbi:MAG TPA: divergent polysaccharide deacetylase family protein [Candidatus Acidoferrales bacterium]|nr:divergent polysaccharide deacetylase family protein [Candidatus Acidoferrales bacterium]
MKVRRKATFARTVSSRRSGGLLRFAFFSSLTLLFFSAGCAKKQKPLTPAQVHAITREFQAAVPRNHAEYGRVWAATLKNEGNDGTTDHLFVTLLAGGSNPANAANLANLLQALDRVAMRHALTRDPLGSANAAGQIQFLYRHNGTPTHAIHILTSQDVRHGGANSGAAASGARLAIIIDDLGYDRASADAVFALQFPLTISVLPGLAHSADVDEEAKRRGWPVMLHLPMASTGNGKPEAIELHPGMSAEEVSQAVAQMLATVPDAIGVNNHQGSEATADANLMAALMPVLREYKLFFVDSRTTAATVAYDTARQMGIPAAYRNVPFLDDSADVASIRKQLALAVRDAQKQGAAIAIGHPHPATLQVLQEMLPQLEGQGVTLVSVSQLVQ